MNRPRTTLQTLTADTRNEVNDMGVIWKMSGVFKADAEKVSAEIESIGSEATPAEIVEKAKDESTELHKCFEWDDSIAAQRWRLQQARQIVCLLVYEEEKKEKS